MGGAKKAGKAKKASKAQRDAPYAWVTDCDGVGGFTLGGVIPLRSGFDVHLLMLRTGDGVRDGYHKGGQPTDVRDTQREWTSRAVKFPLSAAYELFVRGALDRTPAPGPPVDALREIAFFRSFSSPLAPEHARLVFARPSEETLARAGSRGLSNTSDVFESLGLSSSKVEAAVDAVWNTLKDEENRAGCTLGDMWYVNRGQLLDLGLDPDAFFASTREEARVKVVAALGSSPLHVDRHATMTHHTSVIFDLAGDKAQAEAFATVRDLGLTAYEMSSVSMHIVRLTLCALVQDHRRHGGPRHYFANDETAEREAVTAVRCFMLALRDSKTVPAVERAFGALAEHYFALSLLNGLRGGISRARNIFAGFSSTDFQPPPYDAREKVMSETVGLVFVHDRSGLIPRNMRFRSPGSLPTATPRELAAAFSRAYEAGGLPARPASQVGDLVAESFWTRVVLVAMGECARVAPPRSIPECGPDLVELTIAQQWQTRDPHFLARGLSRVEFNVAGDAAALGRNFEVTGARARAAPAFVEAIRAAGDAYSAYSTAILDLARRAPAAALNLVYEFDQLERLGTPKEEVISRRAERAARAGTATCDTCARTALDAGVAKLLKCAGCGGASYCSAGCQKEAWPAHRADCKKARAEAR